MFPYLGSLKRLAKKFPAPMYDTIIEPFAGSAPYSCLYWERNVIINETDPRITNIWKFIQQTSPEEILKLPEPKEHDLIEACTKIQEVRDLIGLSTSRVAFFPYHSKPYGFYVNWIKTKQYLAANNYKIKHWKILNGDYALLKNQKATWFLDPPAKKHNDGMYSHMVMDYADLYKFVKSREGQLMMRIKFNLEWIPEVELFQTSKRPGWNEYVYYQIDGKQVKLNRTLDEFVS